MEIIVRWNPRYQAWEAHLPPGYDGFIGYTSVAPTPWAAIGTLIRWVYTGNREPTYLKGLGSWS